MTELCIIKIIISNKELYNKYIKYISNNNISKESLFIINNIGEYYRTIETHEYISLDELRLWFFHNNPNIKDADLFNSLFDRLEKLDVSETIAHTVVKNLIEKEYSNKIVNALLPVLEDSAFDIIKDVKKLIEEYEEVCQLKQDEDNPFVEDDLESLLEENVTGEGINWRLNCLNKDIGPLRGGAAIHIFARPETGKTTLLSSEETHFASQLKEDECIIHFNNEEKGGKIKLRNYQSCLNAATSSIVSNVEKAKELFKERGGDKIKIYDDASISISAIKKALKKHKPRIVIIDQGDKVSFPKDGDHSNADRLQKLYQIYRELGKEHKCDIITVGQASGEAEGKKWLSMDMMNNSKTGKPGELDVIIGIGCSFAEGDEELRFIHLCKNKLTGTHGKHTVLIDPQKGRYKDVG